MAYHGKDDPALVYDTSLHTTVSELLGSAERAVSAQGRLRSLLSASQAVVQLTEVPDVLRRIAEVALALVDAKYAALGVVAPDGHLEQFIHVGMPKREAEAIGSLPEGRGILGALIDDPHPIRLKRLGDDPRSIGFPLFHPKMESFLGVPIRVRNEVFGNIYVTEKHSGNFTEEDQELLTALAATAGIAIDNARLLEETRRRQKWSAAAAEVTSILLSGESQDSLGVIAERVVELADAALVAVILTGAEGLFVVESARGQLSDHVRGLIFPSRGTLTERAIESGQPVLSDRSNGGLMPPEWDGAGPTMAIPLSSSGDFDGVLMVSRRPESRAFTAADMEMAADFAGQASIALALRRGQVNQARLALLEERGRIARDLHDHVIQRLYAAGIGLQSLNIVGGDRLTHAGIKNTISALDDSIAEIRTAVFALVTPDARERGSVSHRIMDVVSEVSVAWTSSPRMMLSGPLDLILPESMATDVLAVVRESLANVGKHAHSTETLLSVHAETDGVVIDVTDNGIGIGIAELGTTSGTNNLAYRAESYGGEFFVRTRASGGTHLHWSAPIQAHEEITP